MPFEVCFRRLESDTTGWFWMFCQLQIFWDSESSHAPGLLAVQGPAGGWRKILWIPLFCDIFVRQKWEFFVGDIEENLRLHQKKGKFSKFSFFILKTAKNLFQSKFCESKINKFHEFYRRISHSWEFLALKRCFCFILFQFFEIHSDRFSLSAKYSECVTVSVQKRIILGAHKRYSRIINTRVSKSVHS